MTDETTRFETLQRSIDDGFRGVHRRIDKTNEEVGLVKIEVAKVSTQIKSLATEAELEKKIGETREYAKDRIQDITKQHELSMHSKKTLPPPNGKLNGKVITILVGAIAALTGAVTVLVQLLN